MIKWPWPSTEVSCFIPTPKRAPIPAARITSVFFIVSPRCKIEYLWFSIVNHNRNNRERQAASFFVKNFVSIVSFGAELIAFFIFHSFIYEPGEYRCSHIGHSTIRRYLFPPQIALYQLLSLFQIQSNSISVHSDHRIYSIPAPD